MISAREAYLIVHLQLTTLFSTHKYSPSLLYTDSTYKSTILYYLVSSPQKPIFQCAHALHGTLARLYSYSSLILSAYPTSTQSFDRYEV